MPFDKYSPTRKYVAEHCLNYCKRILGRNGLIVGQEISGTINWVPAFYLKPSPIRMIAVHASARVDLLQALKIAIFDVLRHPIPISIYLAIPLESYQSDNRQEKTFRVLNAGIGIITVTDNGTTVIQNECNPLIQFISQQEIDSKLKGLTPLIKRHMQSAYSTYKHNSDQGLQQACQVVEGLISCIAESCIRKSWLPDPLPATTFNIITELLTVSQLADQRSALGCASHFMSSYRNPSSHAPRSAKKAYERLNKCRAGFLLSLEVACNLRNLMQIKNIKTSLNIP